MTITELFKQIKNTSGTLAKKKLLNDNMSDLVKDLFELTYGEHNYYVRKVNPSTYGEKTIDNDLGDFRQVLWQCEVRHITGNEAILAVEAELERFTEADQEILLNLLNHNLKIGISMENFQAVAGVPQDKHLVSLAESLKNVKDVDPVDGNWLISRKLDGSRCVCFIEVSPNGNISEPVFKSRQNKIFQTLGNLRDDVISLATQIKSPGKYVFDGEVCILDENGDEHFDWIMHEITRKDHTIENPRYMIFDFIPEEVFYNRETSKIFSERYKDLCDMYSATIPSHISIVTQERVTSQTIFDKWIDKAKSLDWEGCMIRKDVPYKQGRSKDMLKIKQMQDAEYIVTGTINGVVTYNDNGHKQFNACSALTIEHKGNVVQVGSGLSKNQRLDWYDHPENIIGKTITVQYFEETVDKKTGKPSLRFPVLKYVYEDKREV